MRALSGLNIGYLTLQSAAQGQAAHAHVHEIVNGLRELGAWVDLYDVRYDESRTPSVVERLREFGRVQNELAASLDRYDVIYVRGHPFALPTTRRAVAAGTPVIVEQNGMTADFFIAWPRSRAFAPLIRAATTWQFKRASAVIVGSPGLASWVLLDSGVHADVIPNGVDIDLFRPLGEIARGPVEDYALFFGALSPWQGIGTSIEAMGRPGWPEGVSLVVAGDGVERDAVVAAAKRDSRVIALGGIRHEEVPALVSAARVSLVNKEAREFASAGISPLKLYESMACATPVIATYSMPGLTDVVEEVGCGLLVEQRDPDALAQAVAAIVADPQEARAMGERGRAYVLDHATWELRARDTAGVIRRVLGRYVESVDG